METFADYILNEKSLGSKMEITYYLAKKEGVFFDKSVIFKTEILRMFINSVDLNLDANLILTASLLASCRKIEVSNDIQRIKSFAKEGATYLYSIGFDQSFCDICAGLNRYGENDEENKKKDEEAKKDVRGNTQLKSKKRKKESDVLELVDQFGAMLLDRPERIGMQVDEALVLLEYRNLKDVKNLYLHQFVEFIKKIENIHLRKQNDITPLKLLIKTYKEAEDVKRFITAVVYEYESKVDDAICKQQCGEFFQARKNTRELEEGNPNRPLFSEETTRKVIGKLIENKKG